MNKQQFEKLKNALVQEDEFEIDVEAIKQIVIEQINEFGNPDLLLQDFSFAMATGNNNNILREAHLIRSVTNYIPVRLVWLSQFLTKNKNFPMNFE